MAHGVAEVEWTLTAFAAFTRETCCNFAREWIQRFLEVCHFITTGVHEFNIFRKWLTQSLCHGFCTTIGNELAANFCFNFLLELLDATFHLIFIEALFKIG